MELSTWIDDELATVEQRITTQVLDLVPAERLGEKLEGSSSLTFLLWHISRHHDLAVNAVLLGRAQILESFGDVANTPPPPGAGLPEAEDASFTSQLDPDVVIGYHAAVVAATRRWVTTGDLSILDTVVDGPGALTAAGVSEEDYPWLHRMWGGKTGAFFARWEAALHEINHLGEMVAVRNRMGLSPF